jgi:DNA-binding response OmpR family regulator
MSSKILLAGSERMIQQVAETLDAGRLHLAFADDGYAALCLLNETIPDLLIAETALPDKDGYALCRYIRQEPEFQSLPVILLDSQFNVFNQKRAFSAGANIYLSQPFNPDELINAIYTLLDYSEAAADEGLDDRPSSSFGETTASFEETTARQQPVAFNIYDSEAAPVRQEAARKPATEPAFDERATLPPPSAPPRRQGSASFWVVAVVAILIGIGLAILLRMPTQGLRTGQSASSLDKPAQSGALAMAGQPYVTAPEKDAQAKPSTEAAAPIEAANQPKPPASAPAEPDEPSVNPNRPNGPSDTPKVEARQDESKPAADSASARRNSPAAGERRTYTTATRPLKVRSVTTTNHWRRGGQEMVQSGEHFGSGTKHFGKGGAQAAMWAGRKAGGGIKRIGTALKKIF